MSELLPSSFSDCCQQTSCGGLSQSSDCASICIGDGGGGGALIYDTLAQLKAAPASVFPASVPGLFILRGLNAIYDGGYRIYVSDPSSGAVANDYSVVQAVNFSGRLLLLFG
jgi:hypothetical protein